MADVGFASPERYGFWKLVTVFRELGRIFIKHASARSLYVRNSHLERTFELCHEMSAKGYEPTWHPRTINLIIHEFDRIQRLLATSESEADHEK